MHRGPLFGLASDSKPQAIGQSMRGSLPVGSIEQAFQLAYFICPQRATALKVIVRALACVDDQQEEQQKRKYFRPQGYRTKISRTRMQLLQHLVCLIACSTVLPKRNAEVSPQALQEELLIRFVVELVRISTRRNSFYVSLAIGRILHDYTTQETIAIHDLLTQNPERARDEAYFRYGKGLLFKEMRQRFGSSIETTRRQRGELRLSSHTQPDVSQIALVAECLRLLTPWQTDCPLPDDFDPLQDELPHLKFVGQDANAEHPFELRRMHALLHPSCFAKLVAALGFDAPKFRLRVPRFVLGEPAGEPTRASVKPQSASDSQRVERRPSPLARQERAWIDDELLAIEQRRRRWPIRLLDK